MPKITNPVVIAKLREGVLAGKPDNQVMIEAGLSVQTANTQSRRTKVLQVVKSRIAEELTDNQILEQLKEILRLKLMLEREVLDEVTADKSISRKEKLLVINKTKDNIAETIKSLRLVSGESTDNLSISAAEKDERLGRLNRIMSGKN